MECSQIDLYEFLTEAELQHYYNAIKNELKITNAAHVKYATDEDLKHIGLSRPEIRRLRKYYEKHFPHGYLSKIKRLLQAPATIVKRDGGDGSTTLSNASLHSAAESPSTARTANSPSKAPNNKHIIPADSITVNKQLGTGEFGIVQQGVWTNGTERIQVAIKCLCRERMQSNPMEFLKEAAIMHSIEHENIVRLYGVVLATDSLMLVTELAHLRSLLECLKDPGLRVSFLTIPTLCEFAMQICNGMRYLENKRLIHRDLAARNILVFSKDKVKISDFGLSRALGVGKDYYKTNFNVNLKLPIAWCAPECINYLRFTNASDVWAYGVCLWEMFSYGFQPWAALTGLQILEAIDAPNYQRLEQPDCCPQEYYTLMIKCWQDDPVKRPKFTEIYELLPDMKPEQLKAVVHCLEPKKDHLLYRQGDIITVLDRNTGTPFWKGVLTTGKTGFFNPSNTVAYLEGLPSANRDSFCRTSERISKRKLRTEMISKPQNDFKHTGHVGIDGDSFGDIAFLGNSQNYNHVPRQIVTPYKPSEDIEQTPLLLPPTPTSPDSLQTASGYFPEEGHGTSMNPTFISSTENTPKHFNTGNGAQSSFEFPGQQSHTKSFTNPFTHKGDDEVMLSGGTLAMQNNNYGLDSQSFQGNIAAGGSQQWRDAVKNGGSSEDPHEYHEISDDEMTADKLDFGPSLMDEINSMFGSMSASTSAAASKSSDFEHTNKKNEFAEITSKLVGGKNGESNSSSKFGTSSKKKSSSGTVKPISVKDERILNQAIEIANEISARSMNDLVCDQTSSTQSPKRKFSFRFPHLTSSGSNASDKGSGGNCSPTAGGANANAAAQKSLSPYSKKKNFTEELESIPDLQAIIGEEGREAYNSLIERKSSLGAGLGMGLSPAATLLRHLDTNEFELTTAKTLPRRSMHLQERSEPARGITCRNNGDQIVVPLHNAPRPMTLPTRGAAGRAKKLDGNTGAHLVNGGSVNVSNEETVTSPTCNGDGNGGSSPCESPSYLTNTFYKFPESANANTPATTAATTPTDDTTTNPIPLPPRDGKKHIKTNAKRHVRKYPLIIPVNGLQRTLNMVTETTPTEDGLKPVTALTLSNGVMQRALTASQTKVTPNKSVPTVTPVVASPTSPSSTMHAFQRHSSDGHTYQNLGKLSDAETGSGANTTDSASLHFESILEADYDKGSVLQSPDVTDGFYNFSIQKEQYNKGKTVDFHTNKICGLYVNEDELRNLDTERNLKLKQNSAAAKGATTTMANVAAASTNPAAPAQAATLAEPAAEVLATTSTITTTEIKPAPSMVTTATITLASPVDEAPPTPKVATPASPESAVIREKSGKANLTADNELAGNALFKKVRESVELAMDKKAPGTTNAAGSGGSSSSNKIHKVARASSIATTTTRPQTETEYFAAATARLKDSNSVSCEDLLEFSDKKPRGCERGVDSDEVRIMVKVLGKSVVEPTRCLQSLEFIGWDVHKAIKIIKLQNILPAKELSFAAAVEALQKFEWDLHTTALKLKTSKC
ncbi:activated Cdc42 kinase-like isoform X1 [Zeugodacus cucurbitae]|uniref:non-specific protein-tyrosine kinase n=1 Tax=Zeugodacus cucurbitae TaxID=28588 RepID=A0A0A1WHQ6_ZEUCU|nr:activated Cdc42 kinase-like isoform X1 [Zeugodacus cucurbitae]